MLQHHMLISVENYPLQLHYVPVFQAISQARDRLLRILAPADVGTCRPIHAAHGTCQCTQAGFVAMLFAFAEAWRSCQSSPAPMYFFDTPAVDTAAARMDDVALDPQTICVAAPS